MPELAELKIMSDYINQNVKDKTFKKIYHVEKGNIPVDSNLIENFKVESISNGKELILRAYHDDADLKFSIFIGTTGTEDNQSTQSRTSDSWLKQWRGISKKTFK